MPAHFESKGGAVEVELSYTTAAKELALVEGWVGVTVEGGVDGDVISLDISQTEWQFPVADAFTVNKGDVVYIDPTNMSDRHVPLAADLTTTYATDLYAAFRATADKNTAGGSGNHFVTGILLPNFPVAVGA